MIFFFKFMRKTVFRVERVHKNYKITTKHVENQELDKFGPRTCALHRKLYSIILSTFQINLSLKLFDLVKLDLTQVPKFEF
jgi:hypothetical protein